MKLVTYKISGPISSQIKEAINILDKDTKVARIELTQKEMFALSHEVGGTDWKNFFQNYKYLDCKIRIVDEESPEVPGAPVAINYNILPKLEHQSVGYKVFKFIDESHPICQFSYKQLDNSAEIFELVFNVENNGIQRCYIINRNDLVAVLEYLSEKFAEMNKKQEDKG